MTIVHVVEPFATGINTFIRELVLGMPDDKHVIIHGERDDNRAIEEIKKEYKNKPDFIKWKNAQRDINFIKDLKASLELRKILKKINFDILHLHSSKAGVIGRIVGCTLPSKQIVYTPNAVAFLRTDISQKKKNLYKKIEKFFNHFNATIVSSSESEFNAYKLLNINTKIIQNGVNIEHQDIVKKNDQPLKIVTCGKITIQKNPNLLEEIASFFKNDPNVSFSWIGDGELKSHLTNIKVLGWCSREEVYNELKDADIYISTSTWEGLPFAGIEAMAFGLPLLMNECPGNKDLINNGVNGYTFNSKTNAINHIKDLKEDKDKILTLGKNSKSIYQENYANYRCAQEYHKLYNTICKKKE